MRKYYFQTKSFLKNNLLVKTLKAPFCQSFLLTFKDISSMKKTVIVQFLTTLLGFIFRVKLLKRSFQSSKQDDC